MALKDKGGENALEMDLQGGNVTLKAKTGLTLSAGQTKIALTSQGEVSISANQKVSVQTATLEEKGSASVTIQGGQTKVEGTGTLDLQSSGTANLKGAMVSIN